MAGETASRTGFERLTALVGVLGSAITIVLTLWNTNTKQQIDRSQSELQQKTAEVQAEISRRGANVEESKERVERYKWVYGLLPALTDADATKRNGALAMVRLALNKDEAEALLAGLQQSPSPEVREAADQGIRTLAKIDAAELPRLVDQMNAANADDRRRATGRLEREFADSPVAIGLVLERLRPDRVAALSPSGFINTLYYLARTEPRAWSDDNVRVAEGLLAGVDRQKLGAQSKAELARVEAVLDKAKR